MDPKLSIIVPHYNYAPYLARAIDSVATTTYDSLEIILIDDCSTDGSPAIIQHLIQKYPKIRFFKNSSNQGVLKTSDRGVTLSKGEYLHFLSSDDFRLPHFIESTMAVLEKHPYLPLCCSDHTYFIGDNNHSLHKRRLLHSEKDYHLFFPTMVPTLFRRSNFWIPGHTTIIKKSVFIKYGGYNHSLAFLCDWYLFHLAALKEGFAYIPKSLAALRCDPTSYSGQELKKRGKEIYFTLFDFLEKQGEFGSLFRKTGLLRYYVDSLFWELFRYPRYWKYLTPNITRTFERKVAKYLGIRLGAKSLKSISK